MVGTVAPGWHRAARQNGAGNAGAEPDRLNRFLIGIHRRGENLDAHELKLLVDQTSLSTDVGAQLIAFVAPALALLARYDQVQRAEEEWYDDEDLAGPGYLVI
jgi:hypothetical protein